MIQEAYMPEKRSTIGKIFGMFQQGANMFQMGAKGKEGWQSMFGSETAGGSTGGGGGGGFSFGLPAMKSVFGEKAAETGAAESGSTSGGSSLMGSTILGPAAAAGAGYASWVGIGNKQQRESSSRAQAGHEASKAAVEKAGFKGWYDNGPTSSGQAPEGLSLTDQQPDRMSAIERRYNNIDGSREKILEAQNALKETNLPDAERRSIYQKLERAKKQWG